jgi:hypothetical protein
LALWLLVVITLQKLGVSLTHLFKADGGAQSTPMLVIAVLSVIGLVLSVTGRRYTREHRAVEETT